MYWTALAVAAFWGLSPLLQKDLGRRGVPPPVTAVVSSVAFLAGTLLWWWIARVRPIAGGESWAHPRTIALLVLGAGLFATLIPNVLYSLLLARPDTHATVVAALAFTAPAFTALYGALLGTEPALVPTQLGGIAFVILGTALTARPT